MQSRQGACSGYTAGAESELVLRAAGAVKTIIQMLGTEQKRAAAVTMLGKTVERCADQVRPWYVMQGSLGRRAPGAFLSPYK